MIKLQSSDKIRGEMSTMKTRVEHDMLGEMSLPEACYWGIHTQRAVNNFQLAEATVNPALIHAMAMVKKACCNANAELDFIPQEKAAAIAVACDEIAESKFDDQFPVDALQGGAGTSTNMNINEVIANRALELCGRHKGDYEYIDPIQQVNLHQSTNDVYPTALKVATVLKLRELSETIAKLQDVFQHKEQEFADIIKIGRTELQDAVPLTLGAEFSAYSEAFARDRWRTFKAEERIRIVNLGGTAVGTGLTAPRSYIFLVIEKLREITGLGLMRGENCVDQTANADAFVEVSAIMKAAAVNLGKITRDLRQLHFIGEIKLPPVQAGSSIMPGKVNPVICEAVIQGSMSIIAYDTLVTECAMQGTLQINEFMPLLADSLLRGLSQLENCANMLAKHATNIVPCPDKCRSLLEADPILITAFLPHIGYEKALQLLNEFTASGSDNLREFLELKLDPALVKKVLSPHSLTALGYR
ncbi:MAG: aspartate ammonia-lyase [Victivallaceae bacterium]|nr:aspartate ammonia-lyase [Victivallaceae bacterium]